MTNELPELRELRDVAFDLDRERAERMAAQLRRELGRGESPLRFVEPVLVAAMSSSFLVWAVLKIVEVFR